MNYSKSINFPVVSIVDEIAVVAITGVVIYSAYKGILTLKTKGSLKIGFPSIVRIYGAPQNLTIT
jgi:hypothetical protein